MLFVISAIISISKHIRRDYYPQAIFLTLQEWSTLQPGTRVQQFDRYNNDNNNISLHGLQEEQGWLEKGHGYPMPYT